MKLESPLTPPTPDSGVAINHWSQLYGSGMALAVQRLAAKQSGPILLICRDRHLANQLTEQLQFFARDESQDLPILNFPDWETLPYDRFSPHQDIISERLEVLSRIQHLRQGIIVVSVATLLQRLPSLDYLAASSFSMAVGERIAIDSFRERLTHCGYRHVTQVMEHGEFTIRGSIIDIFPMGSEEPYRIELFDDEVETLRSFDPDNQRSVTSYESIQLLPAREFPLTEAAITQFRQAWRSRFSGNPTQCPVYEDVSEGLTPAGIEYYLPLFFTETATLFDYLPPDTTLVRSAQLANTVDIFWHEVKERFEQQNYDVTRPILAPNEIYLPSEDLFSRCKAFSQIKCDNDGSDTSATVKYATSVPKELTINRKATQPLATLSDYIENSHHRILFCAETAGRREVLLELLQKANIQAITLDSWQAFLTSDASIAITTGALDYGLSLDQENISIIVENQLFGEQVVQRRLRKRRQVDSDIIVRDLTELSIGAPVVHIEHGIGRYLGLEILKMDGRENEYLTLEYEGGDRIYVPVTALHLISRYSGADVDNAPLHKLGHDQWAKAKRKAAEKIRDVAAELLAVYAQRDAQKGFKFDTNTNDYPSFAAAFPFEETNDQLNAIDHVILDMASEKTMDRLICGDVGFGKTEVAMRAAFIATQNSKQVVILVPTTLLANQHYENFQDRFADFPTKIELLSRFRSQKENEQVLADLEKGRVDIVIGTHKLLQKGIKFHNLGLLIIDEEHRFGVRQKEQLKSLRSEVDILSLTATPIPRTLNMSMHGMRDISLISTPPAKRLSIKTFCQERNKPVMREAILREIMRGGQVFFLHNNVTTIERTAIELRELIPEAKIEVAHGQMRERELEQVMSDFYHQRFNVVVCTTIIETGIDIPTANTIIIDRADRFGLAQLHQLRGRVGRSHHQAYAYLMTPDKKSMTRDAQKRLDALLSLEDLGAGFMLATHDLEIRGAGELLGEEQSGNMQAIGYTLYMELLERAVKAIQQGVHVDLMDSISDQCEVNLNIGAIIPDDYMPDVHTRLILYKRIANAADKAALRDLQVEMIDRFGLLPDAVKNLFRVTELKLRAQAIGIKKVEANAKTGKLTFTEKPQVEPMTIIKLVQEKPLTYKLQGPEVLRFTKETESADLRIKFVGQLLAELDKSPL